MRRAELNELFIATSKVRFLAVLVTASVALTFGVAGCNKNGAQNNATQETAPHLL
jgi:hypothetical protein